jgi:hypothetical protein
MVVVVVVVVVVVMMEDGQRGSRGGVVQGQDRPKSSCSPFFVSRACRTQDTPAGLTGPRNGGLGWGDATSKQEPGDRQPRRGRGEACGVPGYSIPVYSYF